MPIGLPWEWYQPTLLLLLVQAMVGLIGKHHWERHSDTWKAAKWLKGEDQGLDKPQLDL